MLAVALTQPGGPDVLEARDFPDPTTLPGTVLVRVEACGVNFADVLLRRGEYGEHGTWPSPIIGAEGAGTVVEVGHGVQAIAVGDRVAWPMAPGCHAELALIPAVLAVPVPDAIDAETAAAVIAQGVTAQYLATDAFALGPEHTVLIHAAGGGVGGLLVQFARHRGALVLATASTDEKRSAARAAGASEAFGYEGFAERVGESTGGRGVDVVYDSVGADTFERSLQAVARRGTLVLYGVASGPIPPFDLRRLSGLGSPFVTVPTVRDYIAAPGELRARAAEVFSLVRCGALQVSIAGRFALEDAARAHEQLESRSVAGKLLLLPGLTNRPER